MKLLNVYMWLWAAFLLLRKSLPWQGYLAFYILGAVLAAFLGLRYAQSVRASGGRTIRAIAPLLFPLAYLLTMNIVPYMLTGTISEGLSKQAWRAEAVKQSIDEQSEEELRENLKTYTTIADSLIRMYAKTTRASRQTFQHTGAALCQILLFFLSALTSVGRQLQESASEPTPESEASQEMTK